MLCQLKKPFKDPRQRRGSCWVKLKGHRGVIDLPSPGKSMIFYRKETENGLGKWPDLIGFDGDWGGSGDLESDVAGVVDVCA